MIKSKFQKLRKKYRRFVYENYSWRISKKNLEILFSFKIEPDIFFQPKIIIKNVKEFQIKKLDQGLLNNLIFHLGLIEVISYWKATCSQEIQVLAGSLNKKQISWWHNLIIKGMGQFFYENKINFKKGDFLKINSGGKKIKNKKGEIKGRGLLIPISGGKDSILTLELLKKFKKECYYFCLNPNRETEKILKKINPKHLIIAERAIDKKLLELNNKNFLNGHIPFSAYLAFLTLLTAVIFNKKYLVFSNEKSSNEGNLKYLGKTVNHQWSKSFEFEEKFRDYSQKYLIKNIEYFSFLRPLYEIQIAKLFSKFPKYLPIFLSCNKIQKIAFKNKKVTKKWCGECSKCLFVFTALYPFVQEKKLIKIFKKNLFQDKKLLGLMRQLIGEKGLKPFECVGTKNESLTAFYLSWKKAQNNNSTKMPILLKYFEKIILNKSQNFKKISEKILNSWDEKHNLPKNFEKILKNKIISK